MPGTYSGKRILVGFQVNDTVGQRLENFAAAHGLSRSAAVRLLVAESLDERERRNGETPKQRKRPRG
jgi:hypothetical protein